MPSPFPGMDPFLESPDWFPDLRDGLIFTMQAALQACLPRMYYARSRQHVWLDLRSSIARALPRDPSPPGNRRCRRRRLRDPQSVEQDAEGTMAAIFMSPSSKRPCCHRRT